MNPTAKHCALADLNAGELQLLAPSPFVLQFAAGIVKHSETTPILDVACGGCRNAALLAHLGAHVIGLDIDIDRAKNALERLRKTRLATELNRITLKQCDLKRDAWPIAPASVAAVINVHFLHEPLLHKFLDALQSGGFLLLETVAGHGGNFNELPVSGRLKQMLLGRLRFLEYQERSAGPKDVGRVSVKLAGLKIA